MSKVWMNDKKAKHIDFFNEIAQSFSNDGVNSWSDLDLLFFRIFGPSDFSFKTFFQNSEMPATNYGNLSKCHQSSAVSKTTWWDIPAKEITDLQEENRRLREDLERLRSQMSFNIKVMDIVVVKGTKIENVHFIKVTGIQCEGRSIQSAHNMMTRTHFEGIAVKYIQGKLELMNTKLIPWQNIRNVVIPITLI